MAAGLSIKPEGFKDFQAAFEEVIRSRCDASVFERVVLTDGGLAPDEITEALCQEIDEQIWGQGFEAPLFANEVHVLSQTLLKGTHLKMIPRPPNRAAGGGGGRISRQRKFRRFFL